MLLVVFSVFGPIDDWAETSTAWHMTQHMLFIIVIAPLWALARPLPQWRGVTGRFAQPLWTGILRAGRYPLLALLHGAVIWIWHTPKLYVLALDNLWWHAFEHACFLFTGWLFWWSVLRANPKQVPQALMAVLLTLMHTGLLGALLTFGSVSFYGEGRSVEDQQLAGLIMWVPGADLPDRRRLDRLALADPHVAAAEYASRRAGSLTRNGGASALREGAVSRVSCESSTDRYRPRPAVRPDHGRGTRRTWECRAGSRDR